VRRVDHRQRRRRVPGGAVERDLGLPPDHAVAARRRPAGCDPVRVAVAEAAAGPAGGRAAVVVEEQQVLRAGGGLAPSCSNKSCSVLVSYGGWYSYNIMVVV
jgi:hypothetical protein